MDALALLPPLSALHEGLAMVPWDLPWNDWSGYTLYLGCAVGGGAVLALQTVLLLFGGDFSDGDVDAHSGDAGDGFGLLSIRTIAAFLTIFGLVGMYGTNAGWGAGLTLGAAFGSGLTMMVVVAWLFSLQKKLAEEGTLEPSGAVGCPARVYLRIPGERAGKGKITVAIQGRTAEFEAVTAGPELPTGADAHVVRQIDERTFEVEAAR